MPDLYFIGVDVGTGSTRAALVNQRGEVLRSHVEEISIWNFQRDHYEQSSDNIWEAVCKCVKTVSNIENKKLICGIGFDATCSLVALDKNDDPISVSLSGKDEQNVILWMDHRATVEADKINDTKHDLLKYVGGKVSLEMEFPKILWLKNNLYISTWIKIGKLFDLPDFLTWKCTGENSRSLCSVVCKWNYDSINDQWSKDFLTQIGLSDLYESIDIIGRDIREPGESIGEGLTVEAAEQLGLYPNMHVATSMIDAHAGALSLFGCKAPNLDGKISRKMALICGTSSCHMSVTETPILASGIWGPYKGAIFTKLFLHEAGQSATGILLEYVVKSHPAYDTALKNAKQKHINEYLNNLLQQIADEKGVTNLQELTKEVHVWPDYHGNRSPVADTNLKGMISGLTMTGDEENLAIIYLAFIQALAYGTRHILNALKEQGRPEFESLLICGGLSKNPLFVQTHAEACGMPVLFPMESEMVLVGAAILGACAAKVFPDLESASKAMGGAAHVIHPNPEHFGYHDKKYTVFLKMLDHQIEYRNIMN